MHGFHAPVSFAKFDGQPIEQRTVNGIFALDAEVFRSLYESDPEEMLPHPIHLDARGERIFWSDKPLREAQAIGRSIR